MKLKIFALAMLSAILPVLVFAQESGVSSGLEAFLVVLGPVLGTYAAKFPWLGILLLVMLYARIIMKPIMSAIITIGKELPESKAQVFLASMSGHWAYKIVAYLLDWFGSIKIPKKK